MTKKIGRFKLIRLLGRGGMAEVYLAYDSLIQREVAIKLLPKHFLHDAQFKARFEREARVLARLNHPNIVPVHDFGYHEEQPYMVSRYMAGGSLESRLKLSKRMQLMDALGVLQSVSAALEAAHKKGIVHRDIKPGNILFDEEDVAYIADFGIAKLAQSSSVLTGTAIIGTPAYMSPEQFKGEAELDGRSDQYSLAIVVFEMLSGKLPFRADTTAKLMQMHLMEEPPSLSKLRRDIPQALAEGLARALSKKPAQRYARVGALFNALHDAAGKKPSVAIGMDKKARQAKTTRLLSNSPRRPKENQATSRKLGWFRHRFPLWQLLAITAGIALVATLSRSPRGATSAASAFGETPTQLATVTTSLTPWPSATVAPSQTPAIPLATQPLTVLSGAPLMPDVVGMHYRDAVTALNEAGLNFSLDGYRTVCDFNLPVGTIKRQEPEAGKPVVLPSQMTLYRVGVPNRLSNGYADMIVNSRQGTLEFVAELSPGIYDFQVVLIEHLYKAQLRSVDFLDTNGDVLRTYPVPFWYSRSINDTITVTQDSCYMVRVFYHNVEDGISDTEIVAGFRIGFVELIRK